MVMEVSGDSFGGDDFERAERECVPVVMRGLVHDWPAVRKWKGAEGLQYMKQIAGDEEIKVMCSESDTFYGAIEKHRPMTCRFDEFVDDENKSRWKACGVHTYLAQTPINKGSMKVFLKDLAIPAIVQQKNITQINLWMAGSSSRSSPHYDPYHNVLCVVTGSKRVKLCNPNLTPNFYPLPVWGDSANHSAVNFTEPNFEQHPNYRHALEQGETITLHAGDALFIPEGWWHQVDSQGETIGVNFWWRSQFYNLMQGHMGAYYLRESLRAIAAKEVDDLVRLVEPLSAEELCGDSLSESESDLPISESMSSPTPLMADCASDDDVSCDCSSSGTFSDGNTESGEDPPVDMEPQQIMNEGRGENDMHAFDTRDAGHITETASLPSLSSIPTDRGGCEEGLDAGSPRSPESGGSPQCCVSLVDLEDHERQGILWLAGLLCSRATSDGSRVPDYSQASENVTRWLRSFPAHCFCRIIYVFARSLPNLVPLFWEMVNPVGAYIITHHLESLEGNSIKGIPGQQEFFSRIYGENEDQVLPYVLSGRGTLGKFATIQALERQLLISVEPVNQAFINA
ncbi:hypothetical protein BSKO_01108 [Bryopsis sp. KO-2023]|nr:hypothetical protein BSKO_01108 [Bryopsis sp. KO-2023]